MSNLPELASIVSVAHSFPTLPNKLLIRENLLDTIRKIFEQGIDAIFVEGESSIGKTILLAQFCEQFPLQCSCLFIRPVSRLSYDPSFLRFDLCNQLHWILQSEQLPENAVVDDAYLPRLIFSLQRRILRTKKNFFFVIDGLDAIPSTDNHLRDALIDLLPLGVGGFKWVFSGDVNKMLGDRAKRISHKTFPLPPFTSYESGDYLGDIIPDEKILQDIHRTCKGLPGHLASVRRIVTSGVSLEALIADLPSHLSDLFEIEWLRVKRHDERECMLLSLLAFCRSPVTLPQACSMLDTDGEWLREVVARLGFVQQVGESFTLQFVSDGFRRFASQKLESLREAAISLQMQLLLKDEYADDALTVIPIYLSELERHEALLDYLQDDYFIRLLHRSGSLSPILAQNLIGLDTARRTVTDNQLFRLSLQRSVLFDLAQASAGASEIQALISLGEPELAIQKATEVLLAEDRLYLLSVIAKEQRASGTSPEQALLDQLDAALEQVNPGTIGQERALSIASQLIAVRPEHAISLVEKATSIQDGENALDWALARLSIAALHEQEGQDSTRAFQSIKSRVTNRDLDPLFSAAKIFIQSRSAEEVVTEVKNLVRAADQLFLLRHWCLDNARAPDAHVAIEYGFSVAIGTKDYVPNATAFLELASPLPYVVDTETTRRLVGIADGQRATLELKGPTEAFVRLQLTLAHAEIKYQPEAATRRLLDLYFETLGDLENLPQRAACLAWFLGELVTMPVPEEFVRKENLPDVLSQDLGDCIDKLLSQTADHDSATKDIITALASSYPDKALDIARSLNTLFRRDFAIEDLVDSLLSKPLNETRVQAALTATSDIDNWRLFDKCVGRIIERCARFSSAQKQPILCLHDLIRHAFSIHGASQRTSALALLLKCTLEDYSDPSSKGLTTELEKQLWASWEALDGYWIRVDLAFRVASQLAKCARGTAVRFRQAAESLRSAHAVLTEREVEIRFNIFNLLARAYHALVESQLDAEEDFKRLEAVLNTEISDGEKALLWSQVIMALAMCGRDKQAKELTFTHLRPAFDRIALANAARRAEILIAIAPALWIANRTLTLELLSTLPRYLQDDAIESICSYILFKIPHGVPYGSSASTTVDAEYSDLVDVIELLSRMESDYSIAHFVKIVSDTAITRRKGARFTAEQVADVSARLAKLIDATLPSQRYIKHPGYHLLCHATTAQLASKRVDFKSFVEGTEQIPNLPDQAYVLIRLAEAMPGREHKLRLEALHAAKRKVDILPLLTDQIDRYHDLGETSWGIDSALAKKCMQEAFALVNVTQDDDNDDIAAKRRRLIDLAYRFDKDLASSYASITDQDPARKRASVLNKRRIRFNDLKESLADEQSGPIELNREAKEFYPRICWRLWGELNANRIAPLRISRIREMFGLGAHYPLTQAYSIYSYAMANLRRTYASTDQGRSFVRPAFEALVGAANFLSLISNETMKIKSPALPRETSEGFSSVTVGPGEREKGIAYIKRWLEGGELEQLVIADPYFGVDDLEVLQLVAGVNRGCLVRILTSEKHQLEQRLPKPWDDCYRAHWAKRVSDQQPPTTDIVVVGLETTGESPLHDRWWIAGRRAIRLGTSFNGLGNKLCEVSLVHERDVEGIASQLDRYLVFREREHLGRKLRYTMFSL